MQHDRGIDKDERGGAVLLERSCRKGLKLACFNLALWLQDKEPGRAESFFHDCCAAKMGDGCRREGDLLLKRGKATAAASVYRKACDLQDGYACYELSHLLEQGIGVAKDVLAAHAFQLLACRGGYRDACPK
jgi:TPR repeat protein